MDHKTVDNTLDEAYYTPLALDDSGNPHISYIITNGSLKYATKRNGSWSVETIDASSVMVEPSLAVDSSGNAHISYCDWDNQSLKYAYSTWQFSTITAACVPKSKSKPLIAATKNTWLMLPCSSTNHFDRYASHVSIVGSENSFQGVAINTQKKPFAIGKFIFVPINITKTASSGNWRVVIYTELPAYALKEQITADFKIR